MVVKMQVHKLHVEGAPTRMEGRFWVHWNKPLNNILTWEQHRKLAWIETARLILEKAQQLNDTDGTTQMKNTMQGWLQMTSNADES